MPNIGIGAYYKRKSLFISIGVPRLLSTEIARESNGAVTAVRDRPHLYTAIGYDFSMNIFKNIRIKPSMLSRYVAGAPISIDFNTMVSYRDSFELGATYRPEGNYAGIILFNVSKALKIGWTYETNTLPELSAVGASLELSVRYKY
jgi:type IX secretion system PorP/SprF family membrane protein